MPTERQTDIILESELEFKPYNTESMAQSNEPTIEQMDKAIAEFMELETDNEPHLAHRRTVYLVNGHWWPLRKLKYHTSWDWLIPCWNKLRTELFQCMPASGFNDGFDKYGDAWKTACFNAEIQNAHKVVYSAIKWLNQQKQPNV